MAQIDPRFGREIKRIRESRGLTQQQIIERLAGRYNDVSSYGRVEQGRRRPSPGAALAILTRGLELTDSVQINRLMGMLDYEPPGEVDLGLASDQGEEVAAVPAANGVSIEPTASSGLSSSAVVKRSRAWIWFLAGGIGIVTVWLAIQAGAGLWFTLSSAVLYASLYGISIYLETTYWEKKPDVGLRAGVIFCFMTVTSALALSLDSFLVRERQGNGLVLSLSLFLFAAIIQWFLARAVLPDHCVVGTHTGQVAHLKNTGYFLVIVVLFWVPTFHAIAVLREAARTGQLETFRPILTKWILISNDILCFNVGSLLILLFVGLVPLSLAMRGPVLDHLPQDRHLNRYTLLFHLRAGVFFLLCLVCIGWFHAALGKLPT